MSQEQYVDVLWVENDPQVTSAYPREAEMSGIYLHPVSSWEEAKVKLDEDYGKWKAIILDAKCQYAKGDADLADRFLGNVFPELKEYESRNHPIPWYVLSGQGEEAVRNLIPVKRDWDIDWEKETGRPFYSKIGKMQWRDEVIPERQILFQRIRDYVEHYDHEFQLKNDICSDVFSALKVLEGQGLKPEASGYLILLLEPIFFKGTKNQEYNKRYVELRKSLELIFRDMVNKKILPPCIITSNGKDTVNLSWSSIFLGGELKENMGDSERNLWKQVTRVDSTPLLPKQLADWLKAAIFQTGAAAHTSETDERKSLNYERFLQCVDQSPYMLRSLAMGLCDFILWYNNFLKDISGKDIQFWTLNRVC
jgi:hypothetical protein